MKVGLDVGSTTIKCVVLDDTDNLIYSTYERHYSHILEKSEELLRRVAERYGRTADLAISGSAGMGMAESVGVPFVQEVFATRVAANRLAPGTDCIIELGGEDAKILFLTGGMEVRMNGSCAGGTGAFIDQMATLLKMSADEMDAALADLFTSTAGLLKTHMSTSPLKSTLQEVIFLLVLFTKILLTAKSRFAIQPQKCRTPTSMK